MEKNIVRIPQEVLLIIVIFLLLGLHYVHASNHVSNQNNLIAKSIK